MSVKTPRCNQGRGSRCLDPGFWLLALGALLAACAAPVGPTPTPASTRPLVPRPTFAFPAGTPVPITSAEGALIETEPGPLLVILSTVDEHGLPGEAEIALLSQPDPAGEAAGHVPSRVFAEVLEIRRLPPDYLRAFYRVRILDEPAGREGWVGDWYARRTAFVLAFDAQGCACPFSVPLWADAALEQPGGSVANRSPLRVLAAGTESVQVQVLSDGLIGWLSRSLVYESQDKEFIHQLRDH